MTPPTRRDVLKLAATAAAAICASGFVPGCRKASPNAAEGSPGPTVPCGAGDGARVVAVRGTDLSAMTHSLLEALGGIQAVVRPGDTVFIKPNMVTLPWSSASYDPFRLGECTKPEIVIAVIEECLRAGAREVTVGDGSQMPTFQWSGAVTLDRSTNLATEAARLSRQYGRTVRLACLDADTPEWVEIPVGTSVGSVVISSLVTGADRVISIPVAKTHRWAYLTLSLKNFIGITPLARYGWNAAGGENTRVLLHRNDATARGFGRLFVDIARAAKPDLAIIDMSIGMEGNGPSLSSGGRTVNMADRLGSWLLLGSTDAAAADATAARVLDLESPYVDRILSMAHDAGLGTICASAIQLEGATLEQLRVRWAPAQVAFAGDSRLRDIHLNAPTGGFKLHV